MARTDLPVTEITLSGVDPAGVAGTVDGHMLDVNGKEFLEVSNSAAAAQGVTITTPHAVQGLAVEELVVSVPAGGRRIIGPFDRGTFGQPASSANRGKAYINYAAGAEATFLTRAYRV